MIEVIVIIENFCIALMLFWLFEAFLERKTDVSFGHLSFCLVLLFIGNCVVHQLLSTHWKISAVAMAFGFFISIFLYNGSIWRRVGVVILLVFVVVISRKMVQFIMMVVFSLSLNQIEMIPAYRLLRFIVTIALGLVICDAIRVRRKARSEGNDLIFWLWFAIVFMVAVYICFLLFWMSSEIEHLRFNALAVVGAIGVFFSAFFAIYLYERLAIQSAKLYDQLQAKKQLKMQIEHMEEMIAKQREIRRFKHDLSNQLLVLKNYLDRGNMREGRDYLATLTQSFEKTIPQIDTGNSALDTILSAKKTFAESKGITFKMKVQIPMQLLIEPMDLCVIFGNALDNAIEACERIENGVKTIECFLIQQDRRLFCKIVNTAPCRTEKKLSTQKDDIINHGFGLENIEKVLAKYHTIPVIEQKNGIFTFSFTIYI